jgi:hypothetical protein
MRIIALTLLLAACDKTNAAEEAMKQSEAEYQKRVKEAPPAKKVRPPVPGEAKLPCSQVIDLPKFQEALGEKETLTVVDRTQKKGEAAAQCELVRGGKKMSEAEQQALLKKEGRLGILAGDVVCDIRLLCYVLEDPEHFKKSCLTKKDKLDESMGTFACVQVVPTGRFDVNLYRFLDDDTKCVFEIRGGPSNTDNDLIRKCAMTARDAIGPAQIKVGGG